MDKCLTFSKGSEIPTISGYLKIKDIAYNKILFCDEFEFSEFDNCEQLKFIGERIITTREAELILKEVDGKNHMIFIKED